MENLKGMISDLENMEQTYLQDREKLHNELKKVLSINHENQSLKATKQI